MGSSADTATGYEPLVCPTCRSADSVIIDGIRVLSVLHGDGMNWAASCWGCREHRWALSDEGRDHHFGTGWRKPKETTDATN